MAGGQVFALQRGELLRYDNAGGDFVPAGLSPVPGNMLADSLEGLYLFSCQEQTLTQMEPAAPYGAMATWKVDTLPFTADEIYRAVVAEGVLYLLTAQETAFPFRGVWAYELATGQQEDCPVPATADMTCGEGGQLLLYSAPLGQEGGLYAWRMGSGPQKLCAAPATQAYTPGELAYDPAAQVCYMQANGVILALEGDALRETAYAPDYENGDFRSGAVTPEGCYLRFYSDGSLWPLSLGQPQQEVLRIAGVFPDASLLDAYRQAYPQVAVAVSPELPSQEDAFAQALVNRTLDRHPDKNHFTKDMLVWPDNMDQTKWYYADMQEATNSHTYQMKENSDKTKYENWTKTLPIRNWEALEKAWSNANSSQGNGNVV